MTQPPRAVSPKFFLRVCTLVPHIYFRFHPNLFTFGGVITKKPCHDPKVNAIKALGAYNNTDLYSALKCNHVIAPPYTEA